jgi:hypothetical protein
MHIRTVFGEETITAAQENNLRRLAVHLANLPNDYENFNMRCYAFDGRKSVDPEYLVAGDTQCGTVSCAAGHGPQIGIEALPGEEWTDYIGRAFGAHSHNDDGIWDWCFSSSWADADNTPLGAAQRIVHMLASESVPASRMALRDGTEAKEALMNIYSCRYVPTIAEMELS